MQIQCGDFEIRSVTQDNLNAVLDLYSKCEDFLALGPDPIASMSMVTRDINDSHKEAGNYCGVYHRNGEIVGVVDYIPKGYQGNQSNAYFTLLMIEPSFRNQGLGTVTAETIEAEIKKDSKIRTIFSAVQVNNPKGIRFWQDRGYRIISVPELQTDGTTVFLLQKYLG